MENQGADWEKRAYRGFACPQEYLSPELLDLILAGYTRSLCCSFLDKFSHHLREARGSSLARFIGEGLEHELAFNDVWTLGLGRMRAAMRPGRERECVQAAAQFALDLQSHGAPGEWTIRFSGIPQLQWGSFVLPPAEELTVSSDGTSVVVQAGYAGSTTLSKFQPLNSHWIAENAEPLPRVQLEGHSIPLLMPWALNCSTNDDIRPKLIQDTSAAEIASMLQNAIHLLGQETPSYLRWVSRVIRGIIPLASPADMYLSGSYPDRPGVITCSFPVPTEVLCELLVHESSHQYFHILSRLGEVEDGSDPTLYYSPLRDQGRPLIYILLAYHAVSNMLLFQRDCLENGTPHATHSRERAGELRHWAQQLEPPLRSSPALTHLGSALWEPLAERL